MFEPTYFFPDIWRTKMAAVAFPQPSASWSVRAAPQARLLSGVKARWEHSTRQGNVPSWYNLVQCWHMFALLRCLSISFTSFSHILAIVDENDELWLYMVLFARLHLYQLLAFHWKFVTSNFWSLRMCETYQWVDIFYRKLYNWGNV